MVYRGHILLPQDTHDRKELLDALRRLSCVLLNSQTGKQETKRQEIWRHGEPKVIRATAGPNGSEISAPECVSPQRGLPSWENAATRSLPS
jgi:hypothetical protein